MARVAGHAAALAHQAGLVAGGDDHRGQRVERPLDRHVEDQDAVAFGDHVDLALARASLGAHARPAHASGERLGRVILVDEPVGNLLVHVDIELAHLLQPADVAPP